MISNIVLGTSVFFFCLGESTKSAVSSKKFHQENIPITYNYSTMHFYNIDFKSNPNVYRNKKDNLQRHANIQYAPLLFKPIDEVNISTKTKKQDAEVLSDTKVTTSKRNLELRFYEQYKINSIKSGQATSLQHFDGHNIKLVQNSELNPETENISGYSDRNAHINIRSNIFQSNSNSIIYKRRKIMMPIPSNPQDIDVYAPQSPVKHIMQGLLALENAKIEPVLNPYYVKVPRVHLNIAHGHQIARGQKKALENENLKRIHLNKHKHKFVPDIDVLLEQKSFLYPEKSLKNNL